MKARDLHPWVRQLTSRKRQQRAEAVSELCAMFEPLVKSMAMRYRQPLPDAGREELEQVARLALVEACDTFDHRRWKRRKDGLERLFARHAMWSVRHTLAEYVRGLPNPVRLPGVIMDTLPKLRREAVKLAQQLGREPTLEELTRAVGMPNGKYQRNSEAMVARMLVYDEIPVFLNDSGEELAATTMTPEDMMLAKEEFRALRRQRREE